MTVTFDQAAAAVTAPGQPLELVDGVVNGQTMKVFKNAPPNLRFVFAAARAPEHRDRTFLVYEDETWTFGAVMDRVDALAHSLVHRYGVGRGDRVAVAMRNYPEWVISFAAITSVGAISVSMNSWWTAPETEYALGDSSPKVLIADDQRVATATNACRQHNIKIICVRMPAADQAIEGVNTADWDDVTAVGPTLPEISIDPDDDATILYTSGTTGFPKGAVSTHRAIISALMSFATRAAVDGVRRPPAPGAAPELPSSFILIVPLFHVTGCVPVMLSCFANGVQARDHVQVGRVAGARTDRSGTHHELRRRPHAELGSRAPPSFHGVRHVQPPRRRRRRCAGPCVTGGPRREVSAVRRTEHRVRHDRDERIWPGQQRARLHRPPDEHRPGRPIDADPGRATRSVHRSGRTSAARSGSGARC